MKAPIFRSSGAQHKPLRLLWGMLLACSAVYADPKQNPEDIEFSIPSDVQSEAFKERNAEINNTVLPLVRQGDRLMHEKRYQDAYISYDRALKILNDGKLGKAAFLQSWQNKIQAKSVKARKSWGQAVFADAKKIYLDALVAKETPMALQGFKKAQQRAFASLSPYYAGVVQCPQNQLDVLIKKDRSFYDNIQSFIMDCEKMESAYNFREETSLNTLDPDYKRRNSEIAFLLRQGEVYYRTRQYEKVRNTVEKILIQDPYNQKAVTLLEKTYKKLYLIGLARAENDAMESMADVEWKWSEPLPPTDSAKEEIRPREVTGNQAELYEKLQKTIVDKIEYESADVQSILENLASQYGVHIIPPARLEDRLRKIQYLELEKMPLLDVIRYVCEVAGLRYKIEEKAVMVGVRNTGDMEIGFFDVRKSLIQRIAIEAEGVDSTEKNDSKDSLKDAERFSDKSLLESKNSETKKAPEVTPEMLKEYFTQMGIVFNEGSTISYDERSGRLVVKNTPENLRKMDMVLKEIDIPPPLVLIDAKVMEVSMNALEELGFDWMLTYTEKETNRQFSFTGLNSNTFYRNDSTNYLVNGLRLIPNFGGNNQFNLSVNIRALDQKERGEILCTPRLLVASGYQGKLTVAEERYFPDDWTDAEVEIVNGTSYTYTPPTPEFGDATNVGTVFTVKPTVGSNNYTVLMQIDTDLTRMTGWSSYDYSIVIGDMMYSPANNTDNLQPKVKMPEFSKRKLKSTVKIYDGETVIIGGILENIVSQREDKWPLLGDIPLIGRLFTDSTYASEKVNLMVFVTARLMKGNGTPVRQSRKQGLFEFNDR